MRRVLGRQTYIVLPIGLLPLMKLMKFLRRKFNIKKLRISILLMTLLCFSVFMGGCTNSHFDDYEQIPNDSASVSENYNDDKSLKLERYVLILTDHLINYVVTDEWLLEDYVFSTDDVNNFLTSLCLFKDELSHPYSNKVCISEDGMNYSISNTSIADISLNVFGIEQFDISSVVGYNEELMECIIPIGIGLRNTPFSYNYVSHYIEDDNIYVYVRLFKTDMYGDTDTIDYGEYVMRFRCVNNTNENIEVVSLCKKQ